MATRFWVGGTGTWDSSTTTHWSASTGGAGGATAPVAGDSVTFDASSGGGTVTVDATVSGLSLAVFTAGAFTGTLDGLTNGPINMTITSQCVFSGSGARTINWAGTFTFTAGAGVTTFDFSTTTNLVASNLTGLNLTFTYAGGVSPQQNVSLGGRTVGAMTVGSHANGVGLALGSGGGTVASLAIAAGANFQIGGAFTITGALAINGTVSSPSYFGNNSMPASNSTVTVTLGSATITGAALRNVVFSGAAVNATSSFDMGNNNMNGGSISPPSSGGSVGVIGS